MDDQIQISRCHRCHKVLLTNPVKVEILYDNSYKGKHNFINLYHGGCLAQLKRHAYKISSISKFDVNNSNHIKTLAWSYFKILFLGNPLQPIFDEQTSAEILIYNFEKEPGFPIEMKLRGISNFGYPA